MFMSPKSGASAISAMGKRKIHPVAHWRDLRNLMISMLAAFRVGALGNHRGRPQNGTASTGKLNHSNVREGKASN
jgi:hypothetical protein